MGGLYGLPALVDAPTVNTASKAAPASRATVVMRSSWSLLMIAVRASSIPFAYSKQTSPRACALVDRSFR